MKTKCSSRTSIPIIVIKHVFDEDYSLSHSYMFTESFSGKTVFKLISIEKLQSTPKSKVHDVPYIPRIAECLELLQLRSHPKRFYMAQKFMPLQYLISIYSQFYMDKF